MADASPDIGTPTAPADVKAKVPADTVQGSIVSAGAAKQETLSVAPSPAAEPVLQISGVSFSYPGRSILNDVSLSVSSGEILVLLGPNGAGKSTLVKTISGMRRPAAGHVRIQGGDPARDSQTRRLAGFVPQQLAVYPKLTALENLTAFARLMGVPGAQVRDRADDVLLAVGLAERAFDRVETFSGGMKRRVNIAAALLHRPKLLVLDEPTVGVDIASHRGLVTLLQGLRDEGYALLLTTHDMAEAEELADRVAIIVDGSIREVGTPDAVMARVFGHRREISVTLGPRGLVDNDAAETLRRQGFVMSDDGTTWSGVIHADADNAMMLRRLCELCPDARDISLRRPGLDTLLAHMIDANQPPGATSPNNADQGATP